VNLCTAFPTLFDLVDGSPTLEVDGVKKSDFGKVVDQCYLCDMCYMTKCPYVPPHPWNVDFPHLMLRAKSAKFRKDGAKLRVIVPVLPRISNHTDFDPLRVHPSVDVQFVDLAASIPGADLIVLPGSKSVQADLASLRAAGWDRALARHLRYGGKVIGICGGFQMLGRRLDDPGGVEGAAGAADGLGLLDVETTITQEKRLARVAGRLAFAEAAVIGYEIHMGRTTGTALVRPAAWLGARPDGAPSRKTPLNAVTFSPFILPDILSRMNVYTGWPK